MNDDENPNLLESVRQINMTVQQSNAGVNFSKTSRLSVPTPNSPATNIDEKDWQKNDYISRDLSS